MQCGEGNHDTSPDAEIIEVAKFPRVGIMDDMPEKLLHSFDIFDTCLTRLVARPADAFWVLGERMLAHAGNAKPTPDELTDFRLERMRAEREARAKKPSGEVVLADIYAEFDWLERRGLSREWGMQAEIEMEHELLRPIAAARTRIRRARESGARVIFISDMYFPGKVLSAWLVEHGMARPEEPVYVSGEVDKSKKTGELFRWVAEREGLDFRRWRHVGDHPVSDLETPRKLGIQAEQWCPAELTPYEERAYCALGNVVVASRLAGTMRCVRIGGGQESAPEKDTSGDKRADGDTHESSDERLAAVRSMAVDIGAPLLVAFVLFVLRRARAAGVQRLYFLSRRGELPLKIARVFQEDFPEIELRYLYSSRWAWRPATYGRWCRELWNDLMDPRFPMDLQELLNVLGLGDTKIADDFLAQFSREDNVDAMFEWLSQPTVVATINQSLTERRKLVLAYLDQEGLWERERIALVDDGWSGKTQRDLHWLLQSREEVPDLQGFFFGLSQERLPQKECGTQHVFLDYDREGSVPGSPIRLLIWRHHILEDLFMCSDEGRCIGYRPSGSGVEPVLAGNSEGWDSHHVAVWQQSVLDFAREWRKAGGGVISRAMIEGVALYNNMFFLCAPPRALMGCFENIDLRIDVMGAGKVPLVKRMSLRDVAREQNWAGSDAVLGRCVSYWPEGSLAISGKWIKALVWAKRHGWKWVLGRALQG